MSVTNLRPLRAEEPLELRQACLDVLEWSVLLAFVHRTLEQQEPPSQTVTDIALKLGDRLKHPSAQVPT